MVKKGSGSAKRFGTRYGRRLREKVASAEKEYRGKKPCPFCRKNHLKRVAAGIWECRKCGSKFAGKAYNPSLNKKTSEVEQ